MKLYQDYDFMLKAFEKGNVQLDETSFYFRSDSSKDSMIGYLPQYDKPYWVGCCDIPDGCEFETAQEMFETKIFDGKSLKDRWDEVIIINIGGISVLDWKKSWLE